MRLGAGVSTIALDVTDDVALARAFVDIGPFDHLVTAAAGTLRGRVVDLDTAKARRLFDVKFWGQHQTVKYAAPHISPRGSIVLFSGWISRKPMIEMSTLAAIDDMERFVWLAIVLCVRHWSSLPRQNEVLIMTNDRVGSKV
jgi:NAD(P)-dependent dehydrogenase (short-subunit alcohol dehydrogenase family)